MVMDLEEEDQYRPQPKEHYVAACLALGVGFGVGIGELYQNIPGGAGIGVTVGLILGFAMSAATSRRQLG